MEYSLPNLYTTLFLASDEAFENSLQASLPTPTLAFAYVKICGNNTKWGIVDWSSNARTASKLLCDFGQVIWLLWSSIFSSVKLREFINLFNKYLLGTYYILDTVPGAGKSVVNKSQDASSPGTYILELLNYVNSKALRVYSTLCIMILPLSSKTLLNRIEKM